MIRQQSREYHASADQHTEELQRSLVDIKTGLETLLKSQGDSESIVLQHSSAETDKSSEPLSSQITHLNSIEEEQMRSTSAEGERSSKDGELSRPSPMWSKQDPESTRRQGLQIQAESHRLDSRLDQIIALLGQLERPVAELQQDPQSMSSSDLTLTAAGQSCLTSVRELQKSLCKLIRQLMCVEAYDLKRNISN